MTRAGRIKIFIITADGLRHKFLVNRLNDFFDIAGVVCEPKRPVSYYFDKEEDAEIQRHFAERDAAEIRYFGKYKDFAIDKDRLMTIAKGDVNRDHVFEWIGGRDPKYIVLFGSSIVREPILSYYKDRVINMHLGLSPYYRGGGTNFWPLVRREPECVGVTVHLAFIKVDAGPILLQARPDADAKDGCHDLGCKTVMKGVELLNKAIRRYDDKLIEPRLQLKKKEAYKFSDVTAEAVRKMRDNFNTGMMKEYLDNKKERDSRFPIIT